MYFKSVKLYKLSACSTSCLCLPAQAFAHNLTEMMTTILSERDIQEVLKDLRVCYSLISVNWSHLEKVLHNLLVKSSVAELAVEPIREVLLELEKLYDKVEWKEKTERVFRSCFVLVLAKRNSSLLLTSVEELLQEFPCFKGVCDDQELCLLLKFRNMMKCGITLYDAKSNKGKLMDIAGRLSGKVYTTGGGSTPEAKRREFIYQQIGGIVKKKLTVPRKRKNQVEDETPACGASSKPGKRIKRESATQATRLSSASSSSAAALLSSQMMPLIPLERSISSLTLDDVMVEPEDSVDLLIENSPPGGGCFSPQFSSSWFDESIFLERPLNTSGGSFSPSRSQVQDATVPVRACCDPTPPPSSFFPDDGYIPPPASSTTNTIPAAPVLQRGLTIDFSKPIFTDESFFHLDLTFTY